MIVGMGELCRNRAVNIIKRAEAEMTRFAVFAPVCLALLPFATPARADNALGVGVTYVFNGPGLGIGIRLLSDDREDEVAYSIGVDYIFNTQTARPSLGVHYILDGAYLGGDVGTTIGQPDIDFGLNFGILNTN